MGILRSEIIFLIFGVLSLAMANGQTSNRDRILEEIKRKLQELELVEEAKFEQELAKYELAVRETCNKNGGAKAYANAVMGSDKFANCSMRIFQLEQGSVPSTTALDGQINYFCPKVQPFENCLNPFLDSINPCFDGTTLEGINVLKSFTISVLKYACESNGEHIKTFINDNGRDCLATQQVPLTNCLGLLGRKEPEAGQSNTETLKFHSFGPNSEDCESFKEFESCVDDKLKRCNKPSITKMGNYVVHLLYEKAGCVEILGSAASPTTVINSLLVITGIAMLL